MTALTQRPRDGFRWRSWLGLGVALLLPYGVLNALVGALYPALRRLGLGPAGPDYLLLNTPQDTALFGRRPSELLRENAALATYRALATDLLAGLWLAFGVFHLGVTWFGLRRGERWAWWTLVLASGAQGGGWLALLQAYRRRGVRVGLYLPPLLLYPPLVLPFAAASAWIGLRRLAATRSHPLARVATRTV